MAVRTGARRHWRSPVHRFRHGTPTLFSKIRPIRLKIRFLRGPAKLLAGRKLPFAAAQWHDFIGDALSLPPLMPVSLRPYGKSVDIRFYDALKSSLTASRTRNAIRSGLMAPSSLAIPPPCGSESNSGFLGRLICLTYLAAQVARNLAMYGQLSPVDARRALIRSRL